MAIKSWQVCLGPIYDYLDGKWLAHALRKPEMKRLAMTTVARESAEHETMAHPVADEMAGEDRSLPRLKGWEPSKTACAIVGTELVCAIIVAWVVSPVPYISA